MSLGDKTVRVRGEVHARLHAMLQRSPALASSIGELIGHLSLVDERDVVAALARRAAQVRDDEGVDI